ncbi:MULTISPECIES: sugar phosphate nucleotidyltransferase [Paenibacillus]|uniref:sugar phosphate nucleotidyltransferase n=1 Tax=Paenibacillus TaxID=44249 RepID=UPI002FE19ABC
MHLVLLCGGAGKRLWPTSNELRSKLFVELLPSPDDGVGRESMLGRVCRQLAQANLLDSTLLISHQSQTNLATRHSKGLIPVIGEPFKRGTFTAAALATLYLQSRRGLGEEDIICIAPADVFAGDDFFASFKLLPDLLKAAKSDIALIGTTPTHASDQYGYILPDVHERTGYMSLARFLEKPDIHLAETLLQRKALWNCGVYAFSTNFMLSHMKKAGIPANFDDLLRIYEQLPERSFDKQVAEQAQQAVVLPYPGLWRDIGSWEALSDLLDSNVYGNGSISGHSPGSHIVNELPYPVHVIGVPGIIAAASPDGILIAHKKTSNDIKAQMGDMPKQPMYGEATWGNFQVIDRFPGDGNTTVLTVKLTVFPGKHIGLRNHRSGYKAWTVLAGSGQVLLKGRLFEVAAGEQFSIASQGTYSILAETGMEIMEVRSEDDPFNPDGISYETYDWKDIVKRVKSRKTPE